MVAEVLMSAYGIAARRVLPCYTAPHMKKAPGLVLALALMTGLLAGVFASQTSVFFGSVADDCDGKPYGTTGCPLLKGNSTSAPSTCGNGKLDANEECDNGSNNGQAGNSCSALCRLRYCGDGVINIDLEEDCEPDAEEYYRKTGSGEELVIERVFSAPQCGNYCTPPSCDEDGMCEGGCTMQFLDACQSSSSSDAEELTESSESSEAGSSAATSSVAGGGASSAAASSRASSVARSSAAASSVSSKERSGLAITMEGPLAVQTGQNAIFRMVIRNYSKEVVKNIVVTDYLVNYGGYGGFNLEAATGGGTCRLTGVTVRCSGIDLNPSEAKVIQLNFSFLNSPLCIQRSVQAYATIIGNTVESDESDNETEPVWTTVRCAGGTGVVSSATGSATSSAASLGTGSSLASSAASSDVSSVASSASSEAQSSAAPVAPAVCGDGVMNEGEECDGGPANGSPGNVCGTDCKRVLPSAPASSFDQMRPMLLAGSGGLLALLLLIYAFVKRKAIMGLFGRGGEAAAEVAASAPAAEAPKSLDDVPLDEIEMPWRKF